MSIEDDLSDMLKHANLGGGKGIGGLLSQLIRSTQVRLLKDMRAQLDREIKRLEGARGVGGLDPYEILGVAKDATRDVIEKAYKEKSQTAHPDHGGSNEEMIKVNAAIEVIRRIRGWK